MSADMIIAPVSCLGSVFTGSVTHEVKLSIDSLLRSTSLPAQIVIIVDGPISNSLRQLLRIYEDGRYIEVIAYSTNHGLGHALNIGLEYCRYEIVIRFDTDDINCSARIAQLYQYMNANPKVALAGSYVNEFIPIDSRIAKMRIKRTPLGSQDISKALLYKNAINHPSVAFRKTAILKVGSYEDIPYFEDYYLWLKMRAANMVMVNIPVPLVFMRRTSVLSRRYGLNYTKKELNFVLRVVKYKLGGPIFVISFIMRIILHSLPGPIQYLQDYLPWRGKSFLSSNPDSDFRRL
jgi:glycosyltransferase involved in cell wall biosynthesis